MTPETVQRARAGLRAQQIVWWMGTLAAVGALSMFVLAVISTRGLESLPQVEALTAATEGLRVTDLPVWVRALCATPELVTTAALAVSALLLSPILLAVAVGESFGAGTQRNFGLISRVLVISSLAAVVIDAIAIWQLSAAVESAVGSDEGMSSLAHLSIPWLPFALGVVAGTFRWVIRDGARLEQEVEGVV